MFVLMYSMYIADFHKLTIIAKFVLKVIANFVKFKKIILSAF